jgi:hypothetical protein
VNNPGWSLLCTLNDSDEYDASRMVSDKASSLFLGKRRKNEWIHQKGIGGNRINTRDAGNCNYLRIDFLPGFFGVLFSSNS